MRLFAAYLCLSAFICVHLRSQTAQATLAGEVRDAAKGTPLAGVRVFAENQETAQVTTAVSNAQGQYILQFLPRGTYIIKVQAAGYRPLERRGVELHVAQQEIADFELQELAEDLKQLPAESLSRGSLGLIYNADAQAKLGVVDDRPPPMSDATSSTVSGVIDEQRIRELPLNGRDIYTLFVLLPGVTSDNATRRGLGFSVNGFPVSSSNYLLDGVDNNNVQTTAPVTLLSPDAIHEYRLATANFSAEYGRGAFVANVITRQGGNRWHGLLFEFLINEKLNANDFQSNAAHRPRAPFKEHQFGYTLGGPLKRDRVFLFTSLEPLRSTTVLKPQTITLPTAAFISQVTGPIARDLFQRFPAMPLINPTPVDANRITGQFAPGAAFNSLAASARADFEVRPDRDRLFLRFGSFDQTVDNVIVSPYRGLAVPFVIATRSMAAGWTHRFDSSRVNEAKIGFNRNRTNYEPQVPGVPELSTLDNQRTRLPGNVGSFTEQNYTDNLLHLVDNFGLLLARHHLVFGGDFQYIWSYSLVGPLRIGNFFFSNIQDFGNDKPVALDATVDRFSTSRFQAPDYIRRFRQRQLAAFVQDTWRVSRRLTLNLGLRYEYFGVPHNDRESEHVNFLPGSGATVADRIAAGGLVRGGRLYRPDYINLAPRVGLAFDLLGNSRTVLRAGYGIYYDRPFNLLWDSLRQNNFVEQFFFASENPFKYLTPAGLALPTTTPTPNSLRGEGYMVDSDLQTPHVHTWFAGVQHSLARNLLFEVSQNGAFGRKLATRDILNRNLANPQVLEIQALTNQGASDYLALQTSVLKRFSQGLQFQVSYTWAHAIDNQGDPLVSAQTLRPGFQVEADAAGDRGNSDFDQRHNLIFHGLWQTPRYAGKRWLGGWQFAGIAGYRTGFPLTVVSNFRGSAAGFGALVLPRADFLGGRPEPASPVLVPGGKLLLDPSRFKDPGNRLGNTGRGEFSGPGFWNYDLSVSREFPLPWLGETGRMQLRGEFFNAFNHANLGAPDTRLNSATFGQAAYGRKGASSGSVGTSPLNEFPRRVQLVLRLSF